MSNEASIGLSSGQGTAAGVVAPGSPIASPQSPSSQEASVVQPIEAVQKEVTAEEFHSRLVVTTLDTPEQVTAFYNDHYEVLSGRFGVLLFLYSVMLTRGLETIKTELNDSTEPLIDDTYGYGSQSLINLMLTGSATAHVFDNFEDVGGLSEYNYEFLVVDISQMIRKSGS